MEDAPADGAAETQQTSAPPPSQPEAKKGTGVFFGPALASRLAGSRSSSGSGSRRQAAPRSQSFSVPGSVGGGSRHSSAGGGGGPGRDDAPAPSGGPPRRRASTSMDLSRSPTPQGMQPTRSPSFTAGGAGSSFRQQGGHSFLRPGGHSMPGGPGEVGMLHQLISSPEARMGNPGGSPFADAALQGSNLVPMMLPNQQVALQQQQLVMQQQAQVQQQHAQQQLLQRQQHQQQQQLQQQYTLEQELLQQEQQRLQEVQHLQAQLQQLLQAQQIRAQQQAAPGQRMQQQEGLARSSTDAGGVGVVGDRLAPSLLSHLQPGQQPMPGGMQPVLQDPLAVLRCSALSSDPMQGPSNLSISALGPPPAPGDPSTACGLPILQSSDLAAALQQKLQLQQAQLPVLQEQQDPAAGFSGSAEEEDDAQVAALDGLINQCLARMLQLRNQMAARRAAAAAASTGICSSCSTPTTTPATALTAGTGVLSSAGALTSDSMLLQQAQGSGPRAQPVGMQQQLSGMLSPMSSLGAPLQQQQQQVVGSDGRVLWVQQQQQLQHMQAMPVSMGVAMGGASVLALSGQLNMACQPLQQGSYAGGVVVAQSSPLLLQQQQGLPVASPQQQQVLQPAAGGQLGQTAYSLGGGAHPSGYLSPAAGAVMQQTLLPTPMQQAGPAQGMVPVQQQLGAGLGGSSQQLDDQQLQQLQHMLTQQQLQGLLD